MTGGKAWQIADWNGENGERWRVNQERLDRMLAPYGDAAIVAADPSPGERALDIGCGAGATSLDLAARVGARGEVLGVDISEVLIGRARERVPAGAPLTFEVADAGRAPLPQAHFDLLFSRFGVMFFDDPAATFAHLCGALKPGGRLCFICWRAAAENDWVRLPMAALQGVLPMPPAPDPEAPGPFSFGDRARVTHILETAGFANISFTPLDHPQLYGEGADAAAAVEDALRLSMQIGPLARLLPDQPEDVRERALAALRALFAARAEGGRITIDGAAWIVKAAASA